MSLRILVLQHAPTAPLGLLGERIAARRAATSLLDAERGCDLPPDAAEHDGLVILGGTMNAYDDARCRHFPDLLDLVLRFAKEGRPVLGLCLGAQLVARALGARVRLATTPEFGFVDIEAMPAARDDPVAAAGGRGLPVMQWHDDSFDLPAGAELLFRGDRCPVQAFRAASLWAFQGHIEATPEIARGWGVLRGRDKNNPAVAVRLGAEIARHGDRAARFGRAAADGWLDRVEARAGATGAIATA